MTPELEPIKRSAPEIAEIKRWLATRDIGHENGVQALLRLSKKRAISDDTWGDLLAALPMEEGRPVSLFASKMAERFGSDEDAQAEFLNDGDAITDTVLSRACSEGRLAEGRFWASVFGADWNPNNGSYPLGWASSYPELAQALIDRGANVNQRTPHTGDTPLFLALAEWAMADRRGDKAEAESGPAESARRLLKAGARWAELTGSERGLLASLLGQPFVNGFAAETLGMLSRDLGSGDAPGAALRMREFCVITQASPMEGFDWASARKKVAGVLEQARASAQEPGSSGAGARVALASVSEALSDPVIAVADMDDAQGRPFKTTLLGKSAALGKAQEAGFWADWMGVEWGGAEAGARMAGLSERRPVELAVEFKNAATLQELVSMGATLAGLTADELAAGKELIGDAALDGIFNGLAQNFGEASEESFVDATLDTHEMATRGLLTPARWEALERALSLTVESKANFGYQERGAESLSKMPMAKRGAYPDGAPPVDLYESYQRACETGDMGAARFYARALGPVTPANASDRASPMVKAIGGGRLDIAQMLIDVALADPAEPEALEVAARQGRSREACFLLARGADPASMSNPSALWKTIRPQHFDELMGEWTAALAGGGRDLGAWEGAVGTVLRVDPHGVLGEAHYAKLLEALKAGLSRSDEATRADMLKRVSGLSVSKASPAGETPLQSAARDGDEHKARFWASLRGVEWMSQGEKPGLSPASLALARPDAKMISLLLEMGLDPNAKMKASDRAGHRSMGEQSYAQQAIVAGKGEALLAFLSAGADPFDESEAWVERARATLRSKPEWAKAAQELTLSGGSAATDRLAEEGSLPLAFAERLVSEGQLDRFWRLASAFDWSGSTQSFVAASERARASGISAYAELKTALANDDLQSARGIIEGNLNLLPALAKRGLAEKTLLSAVGVGAAPLLEAFNKAGWPVTAALFKNADAAALSVARSGDSSLLAKVSGMCADALPVSTAAQEDVIVKAAFSGGERFVRELEALVGGFDPSAVEFAVESLSRSAPEAHAGSARALVTMAWDREKEKSAKLSSAEAGARAARLTRSAARMWGKLSDEARQSILIRAAESAHSTFFTPVSERGADNEEAAAAGIQAAQKFASSSQEFLSQLLERASDANQAFLCAGAQLRAAKSDDEALALLSTRQGLIPASVEAMAEAAVHNSLGALRVFLQSADPKTLSALGANLVSRPEAKNAKLSLEAVAMLVDGGAGLSLGGGIEAQGGGALLASRIQRALERLEQGQGASAQERFGPDSWEDQDNRLTAAQRANIEALVGLSVARAYAPKSPEQVAIVLGMRPDLTPFASDAALQSEEMMAKALARDGSLLRHASPVLRANLSVCLTACQSNPDAAAHIHPVLARGLELNTAPEARAEAVAKLAEALKASQSYNPFSLMTRRAVGKAQEAALAQARQEMSQRQREQQVDFSMVYQALSGAGLSADQESAARSALSTAHGMAQDKRLLLDDGDKMLLRRLWENNMPELLNKMAAIPAAERDKPGEEGRSPAEMVKAGVADAAHTMRGIRERSVQRAKTALQAEGNVLADKALRQFESAVENAERLGAGGPAREAPVGPRM